MGAPVLVDAMNDKHNYRWLDEQIIIVLHQSLYRSEQLRHNVEFGCNRSVGGSGGRSTFGGRSLDDKLANDWNENMIQRRKQKTISS